MEVVRGCSCTAYHRGSGVCGLCGSSQSGSSRDSPSRAPLAMIPGGDETEFEGREIRMYYYIPRLIIGVLSGVLTGLFALAGVFAGAVTGALAGRASNSGILRGAGLGAVAGAVLSVEILEASRAYWCSEQSSSRSSSSLADFIVELFQGRLVQERFVPTMFTDYRWQVNIANMSYDEINDVYGEVVSKGLSLESLNKLPCHVITDENKAGCSDSVCCTICLQDMEVGETVRCLRRCHHIFHLMCLDKWLVRHGSCPVCRQNV